MSLTCRLGKVTNNTRAFPQRKSSRGPLWLAIRAIKDKRARQREKDPGNSRRQRTSKRRLIQGQTTTKQALAQLTAAYLEPIIPCLQTQPTHTNNLTSPAENVLSAGERDILSHVSACFARWAVGPGRWTS